MWRRWPIDLELRLAANLIHWCLVSELSHELVRLNVDVLLALGSLRRFHISCEELFGSFGTLLLQSFGVILALVRLEELIGVGASRDNHGRVGASTEDTLVVHDVLGVVLLNIGPSVRVLVLVLLVDDARMGSEALAARVLRQHFLNFYFFLSINNFFL